ncbi:MAG: hypothetical protein QXL14_03115 [Candidatus Aenigmatarchaeota archaeon]
MSGVKTIRIGSNTHKKLVIIKAMLEKKRAKICSFDDVINYLLDECE